MDLTSLIYYQKWAMLQLHMLYSPPKSHYHHQLWLSHLYWHGFLSFIFPFHPIINLCLLPPSLPSSSLDPSFSLSLQCYHALHNCSLLFDLRKNLCLIHYSWYLTHSIDVTLCISTFVKIPVQSEVDRNMDF